MVFRRLTGRDDRENERRDDAHINERLAEVVAEGANPEEAQALWHRLEVARRKREEQLAPDLYTRARARSDQERSREVPADMVAYYRMLALPTSARLPEVERAYRRYVAVMHPDRFRHNIPYMREQEERMRELFKFMEWARATLPDDGSEP